MAKKKGNRILFLRECTICKSRNYITEKNKVNTPAKFEGVMKLCKKCGKHTLHKEVQKLK